MTKLGSWRRFSAHLAAAASLFALQPANAGDVTGGVAMLEVWQNGNVAFTLSASVTTCNQQFVLNYSWPGFKQLYAAVLAAKKTGRPIRVITDGCGPAEGYGGQYNLPVYLYVLD